MKDSGNEKYYSIGEVSSICNISKKALRFYDKIGIILPDKVSEETNYRFYSKEKPANGSDNQIFQAVGIQAR